MKCLHPITVNTPLGYKQVPCGRCTACLLRYRDNWRIRLENEFIHFGYSGNFITLTYDDSNLPEYVSPDGEFSSTLDKKQVQKFLKNLRNKVDYMNRSGENVDFRYFLVGEYGTHTKRPHYHMLLFATPEYLDSLTSHCVDSWSSGLVDVRPIIVNRIQYVCKYTLKSFVPSDFPDGVQKPFALMSKGIGKNALELNSYKRLSQINQPYCYDLNGFKSSLPRYYKNRLFSPEQIALQAEQFALADLKEHFKLLDSSPRSSGRLPMLYEDSLSNLSALDYRLASRIQKTILNNVL